MKPLLLIFISSAFLLLIGCYAATTSNSSKQDSADYKQESDSLFAEYQKSSFNQKRTFSYLKPVLDSLEKCITPVINEPQYRFRLKFRTVLINVFPSGKISLGGYRDFIKPDSTSVQGPELPNAYYKPDSLLKLRLDTIASKFKTDSLPDYKPYFCIPGNITETSSGFTFEFRDSCYYFANLMGGRSKASIMKVVLSELGDLKDAYNARLREGLRFNGKITVKFAIDERGKVIFGEIVQPGTTISDEYLRREFIRIIKTWRFERINKPGDITEVVYPFVLSQ